MRKTASVPSGKRRAARSALFQILLQPRVRPVLSRIEPLPNRDSLDCEYGTSKRQISIAPFMDLAYDREARGDRSQGQREAAA